MMGQDMPVNGRPGSLLLRSLDFCGDHQDGRHKLECWVSRSGIRRSMPRPCDQENGCGSSPVVCFTLSKVGELSIPWTFHAMGDMAGQAR